MASSRPMDAGRTRAENTPSGSRAFWRYWTSSGVSQLGDAVTAVAMPLVALLVLHASAFEVSLVTAAGYAAYLLLGLPAGVLVSALPLRGIQIVLDLARAVVLLTVPVAAWLGILTVGQLIAVAFTLNVATVVFAVANMSYVRAVVPADQLHARNSLLYATYSGTEFAGPAIAGFLIQGLGAAAALLVDVVSFVVSAVALSGLPDPPPTAGTGTTATAVRRQIAEGWRYVTRHPVMGPCLVDASLVNFTVAGMLTLAPVYLVHTLHLAPAAIGLLLGAGGAAALVTALAVPRIFARFGSARASIGAGLLAAAAAICIPAAPGVVAVATFGVAYALWQATFSVRSVAYSTHRQLTAPAYLLPRVLATARFVSWGVMPFGALTAGVVASLASPRAALWVMAAVTLAGPLFLLTTGVRVRRDLTD